MSVTAGRAPGPAGWAWRGGCRDNDPELFFPVSASGAALKETARAKAVCARCLVRSECLSYALSSGQDAGIWGGTTAEERRAMRSRGATGIAGLSGPPARSRRAHETRDPAATGAAEGGRA